MNLYTNSMSADELATCLCVKEITSPSLSPYLGRYVSLLSEPSFSHRTRQDNPFLTPVCQVAKPVVELRPVTASIIANRSNSTMSCPRSSSSKQSLNSNDSTLHVRKESNKVSKDLPLTNTRPSSRSNSSYQISTQMLHPKPASHFKDYNTIKIINRMPSVSNHALRPNTESTTASYLLAPGGRYISQLVISRSSSQANRLSTCSNSLRPASFSTSVCDNTTSCASQSSQNLHQPLTTLENKELDARELELELELQQIQMERKARAAAKAPTRSAERVREDITVEDNHLSYIHTKKSATTEPFKSTAPIQTTIEERDTPANSASMDPLITSITALSRSSSRNVFLESYVAEETVRRCLQRSNLAESQPLSNCSHDDVLSSQASVLTAVHLGESNTDAQNSPQTTVHALKKLISELLCESPATCSSEKQTAESRSESSSPYLNTYSARDYVTHEDVISIFDPDNSLNFGRFKSLAKRFYGRISKGKLWSVAKEIDLLEDIDEKIGYLYSFLFNR